MRDDRRRLRTPSTDTHTRAVIWGRHGKPKRTIFIKSSLREFYSEPHSCRGSGGHTQVPDDFRSAAKVNSTEGPPPGRWACKNLSQFLVGLQQQEEEPQSWAKHVRDHEAADSAERWAEGWSAYPPLKSSLYHRIIRIQRSQTCSRKGS